MVLLHKVTTADGNNGKDRGPTGPTVLAFFALALVALCLTAQFLGMREILGAVDRCGGTGDPACPEGVAGAAVVTPLTVLGLVAGTAVYVLASRRRGGTSVALLVWPATFASLSWNFFEFGAGSPHTSTALLACGAAFALLALAPPAVLLLLGRAGTLVYGLPARLPSPLPTRSRCAVSLALDTSAIAVGIECGALFRLLFSG